MGLDPGTQGGVAVLQGDGGAAYVGVFKPSMPAEAAVNVIARAFAWLRACRGNVCYFEHQQFRRGDKEKAKGISSFMRATGILQGALIALGAELRYPTPQMWQAYMECLSGGNKNVTKRRAQQLFPGEKITHATADALLIAEYGRRRLSATAQSGDLLSSG